MTEGLQIGSPSFNTEFFGPIFNLYKVASTKEILDFANQSDFGLSATVFTNDPNRARDFAERLLVGTVSINSEMVTHSNMPTGGIKLSGFGRECYKDGVYELGHQKCIINPTWERN